MRAKPEARFQGAGYGLFRPFSRYLSCATIFSGEDQERRDVRPNCRQVSPISAGRKRWAGAGERNGIFDDERCWRLLRRRNGPVSGGRRRLRHRRGNGRDGVGLLRGAYSCGYIAEFPTLVPQIESDPQSTYANFPSYVLPTLGALQTPTALALSATALS